VGSGAHAGKSFVWISDDLMCGLKLELDFRSFVCSGAHAGKVIAWVLSLQWEALTLSNHIESKQKKIKSLVFRNCVNLMGFRWGRRIGWVGLSRKPRMAR
jgi:hypothetical protein